jgi:pyridoxine kinase
MGGMKGAATDTARSVIVISSHVAHGSVGNRSIVFALQTLGFPVWAVPTVVLPWRPDRGLATRIVPDTEQFAAFLKDVEHFQRLAEIGAVISGYMGDPGQADAVASLVERLRSVNPKLRYLCDPVIGDAEGLYVPTGTAEAIRDRLLPLADIVTPNRFELAWLAGRSLDDREAVIAAASGLARKMTLVTSAPGLTPGRIGNLLVTASTALLAEHDTISQPPKGPGDLVAAIFLARLMAGLDVAEALRLATASVFEAVTQAARYGADELMLEAVAPSLLNPTAAVALREFDRAFDRTRPA